MVGRRVLLRVEKAARRPGRAGARGREPLGGRRPRRAAGRERLASPSVPARSSASRASPATGRANCWRRSPACAGRCSARSRLAGREHRPRRAQSAPAAPARPPARAGGPAAHGPRAGLRGLRERGARLQPTIRASAAARSSATAAWSRHLRRRWSSTTCARRRRGSRPRSSPAATSRRSCWRARSSATPKVLLVGQPTRGVDIGAIEFIHRRLDRPARRGRRHPARLGRARRDHEPLRPHPRHVRRPHHRRARRGARPTSRISACLMAGVGGGGMMEPRITLVTLGVADLARSRAFYEASAGPPRGRASRRSRSSGQRLRARPVRPQEPRRGRAASRIGRAGLLRHRARLQRPLEGGGRPGLRPGPGRRGATAVKPPHDVFWGGYSGYFADPDGHLWEVACNPFFPFDDKGNLLLPDAARERADRSSPLGRHDPRSRGLGRGGVPRRRARRARPSARTRSPRRAG